MTIREEDIEKVYLLYYVLNSTESRQNMKLREVDNEKVYSTMFQYSIDRRESMN